MRKSEAFPDPMPASTRAERLARGIAIEDDFARFLTTMGHVTWRLPPKGHDPDCFTPSLNILWQVKDGSRAGEHPAVIAEDASYQRALILRQVEKKRVVFIWRMQDGSWRGEVVEHLIDRGPISAESRLHGSGTPARKFDKASLKPLRDLIRLIVSPD